MRFSTSTALSMAVLAALLAGAAGCKKSSSSNPVPVPATPTTPVITGMTPASGDVGGGETVTVNGSSFLTGAAVNIGGSSATVQSVLTSQIVVTTPTGTQGPANVEVINPGGATATLTNGFTFTSGGSGGTPTISSTTPASGPESGGTTITISGTGFVTGATVTVDGNAAANVTVVSGVQITADTPAGTGASRDVVVNNPVSGSATDTGAFTYNPAPVISTPLTPDNDDPTGGVTVTIPGSNFVSGATVLFGSTQSGTVNFVSSSSIEAVAPAGSVGQVSVTVTNPDGQNDVATNAFTYNPAPTVLSLDKITGVPAGNEAVNITGTGFLTGATVLFGTNAATSVVVNSGTSISCVNPAGTGTVGVTVTNLDGQNGILGSAFTYTAAGGGNPTVVSTNPTSGTVNGGTPVTITGTNFLVGATVQVGTTPPAALTSVVVVNSTTITAVTPAGTGTTLSITVTNPGAGNGSANVWSYSAAGTAPSISGLSASSGQASGGDPTTLTITGSNFSTPTVSIDGVNQVVGTSGGGSIEVTLTGAGACGPGGARDVKVTNGNGETATSVGAWTYTHNIPEGLTPTATNPDIAIDGLGVIHVVFQVDTGSGNSDIMHSRSTDNGLTWTSPSPNRITNSTNPSLSPRIAASGNTVVIIWDEQNPTTHVVEWTFSTDNGQNWSTIASIPNGGTNGLALLATPDISIDANGQITAAWVELGPAPPPMALWGPDTQVWTRSGTTANLASGTATQLSGTGTLIGGVSVSSDGTGNAIVAWGQGVNGPAIQLPQNILTSRTGNGGTSWSAAVTVRNGGGGLRGAPAVALKGTSAVIAYCATVSGPQYVCGSYSSTNSGSAWTAGADIRAAGATVVNTASVAADAGGWFMATYSHQGASQTNIFCTRSSDVGVTWATPLAFNPTGGASSVPQIAGGAAGTFKHVWSESNGPGQDVRQW